MSDKEEKSAGERSNKADTAGGSAATGHPSSSDGGRDASITVLRPHDILLGRGSGSNDYEGNIRFRTLIENRKREYMSATAKREDKKRIAQEIFDQITTNGGRFLKKETRRKVNGIVVNNGVHIQVPDAVALEKVKQALRQNWNNGQPRDNAIETNETIIDHDEDQTHHQNFPQPPFRTVPEVANTSTGNALQGFGCSQVNHLLNLSDPLNPPSTYAQLLLFQRAQLALQQQPTLLDSLLLQQPVDPLAVATSDQRSTVFQNQDQSGSLSPLGTSLLSTHSLGAQHEIHGHPSLDNVIRSSSWHAGLVMPETVTQDSLLHPKPDPDKESTREPHESSDREDALVVLDALSTLTMAGRPKFTDQQRLEELALLSSEERIQALMDKFGRLCVTDRQTKKLRRDLTQASITFLLGQMKLELDRIPDVQKVAMLEANAKCRLDEFSDARLIQFLRSEGMNVKLAARRFVKYWECRRETFGPEKFTMRMTLTGALRDDLVAIEEGVLFLLPLVDLSGRHLLFIEPHRRRADRYSPESLLRAIWYILEVAAEKTTNIESDCVLIGFDKTSTIFDFPRATYDRFVEFEKTCLPVRFVATHSCCPNMTMNVMRPIILALTDKRTRARTMVHNVEESAILDALISYGITNDMLPTELGGKVVLNQREWMATRLAEEMEEIA